MKSSTNRGVTWNNNLSIITLPLSPLVERATHICHRRFQRHETTTDFASLSDFAIAIALFADIHSIVVNGSGGNRGIFEKPLGGVLD